MNKETATKNLNNLITKVEGARLKISEHHIVKIIGISKYSTSDDIKILMQAIKELTEWTAYSLRVPLTKREGSNNISHLDKLIELNKEVAIKCKKEFNTRFFGNLSTRCMKLFPSLKTDAAGSLFLVSARNVDKEFLTKDDMIFNLKLLIDRKLEELFS